VKIQTFLWTSKEGLKKYISVFPDFIIKYNKVSTELIEFISTNVGKGETVFNYIDDPECLVENEDTLVRSCERVNNACEALGFAAQLNSRYTSVFSAAMTITPIPNRLIFKHTVMLLTAGVICFETGIIEGFGLSYLNAVFKFLR
jgi:hypothetical protein